MDAEINFCKAGEWAVDRISDELDSLGIEFELSHDDHTKCGVVRVDEGNFAVVANIVMYYTELKNG